MPLGDKIVQHTHKLKWAEGQRLVATVSSIAEAGAGTFPGCQTVPPIEALRAWLSLFVDGIAGKQLIAPAVNRLVGDPKKVWKLPTRRSMKPYVPWSSAFLVRDQQL
jgi:hypothetical protein